MQSRTTHKRTIILLIGLAISQVYAQPYTLKKQTISNGGGKMFSNDTQYEINSSIGQVDASNTLTDSTNRFMLNGGFWHPKNTTPKPELIFKDGFEQ